MSAEHLLSSEENASQTRQGKHPKGFLANDGLGTSRKLHYRKFLSPSQNMMASQLLKDFSNEIQSGANESDFFSFGFIFCYRIMQCVKYENMQNLVTAAFQITSA